MPPVSTSAPDSRQHRSQLGFLDEETNALVVKLTGAWRPGMAWGKHHWNQLTSTMSRLLFTCVYLRPHTLSVCVALGLVGNAEHVEDGCCAFLSILYRSNVVDPMPPPLGHGRVGCLCLVCIRLSAIDCCTMLHPR